MVRSLQNDRPQTGGPRQGELQHPGAQGGRGRVRRHRHGIRNHLDAHLRLHQEQGDSHRLQWRELRETQGNYTDAHVTYRRR